MQRRWLAGVIAAGALMLVSACLPADPEVAPNAEPNGASNAEKQQARTSIFAVHEETPNPLRFNWHYQRFLEHLVEASGRVIDNSGERSISTSEGQAYGMWFALLAQDETHFQEMLQWANNNLAEGALGDRLPSWLWGEDEAGDWRVLDNNPASDADIWMAYALYAAAEQWQQPRYAAIAERLARRILATTTVVLRTADGEQIVLLPAPYGFTHEHYVLVNPSYFSLVQLRGLAAYSSDPRWQQVYESSVAILQQLAQEGHGVVPDWLALDYRGQVISVAQTASTHTADVQHGDYDAIRTYLWLAQAGELLEEFSGMYNFVNEQGYPAERLTRVATENELPAARGRGNIGFSAVLLPYLAAIEGEQGENVREQMARIVAANPNDYRENYYTQMLLMFGLSAVQCTEFHADGRLRVSQEVLNGCI